MNIFLMIIGFALLIKGADFLVKGATGVANKFHLSQLLIGIVIVGIGTSLPEIIITIKSAIEGKSDILIGNGIGSSICNILLVVGIAAICRPIKIDKKIIKVHLPISILSVILLGILCNLGNNKIDTPQAIILLIFTIGYVIFTTIEGKESDNIEAEKDNIPIWKIGLYIILGIIFLKYGADLVVDSATEIARHLNISEAIIGMTIIAVGTTLPEIITSVVASKNKESELAIGNVIGSNIFNICLIPAIGGTIGTVDYDTVFNISLLFLIFVTVEIIIAQNIKKKNIISRKNGIALSSLYILYTLKLIISVV